MSALTAFTGARIFDGDLWHQGAALLVEAGRIAAIVADRDIPAGAVRAPLDGARIVPGFVDLQVNGGGGVLLNEQPEFYIFNGGFKALTGDKALHAKVGETVRIFFGVGGPNKTSSFHVIGEIFDHVYPYGSLTSTPIKDVQTVTVAPGGATVVDFKLEVPGNYILVDHALSRLERGGAGILTVEGPANPEVFNAPPNPHKGGGH